MGQLHQQRAEVRQRPRRVELGAENGRADRVRFWVQDNGPSLTPEAQAKLFTEFTRLEKVRGLGLSIALRIVAKLGSEVGVESEAGAGSRFWFELPKHVSQEHLIASR
jgi:signal transduction histidine kinase